MLSHPHPYPLPGRERDTNEVLITGRLVVTPPLAGALNMAIDELLLRSVQALRPLGKLGADSFDQAQGSGQTQRDTLVLRFFQWALPTLSLGRLQPWEEGQSHPWAVQGRPVVRRPTGGGAVEHDQDLSFSLVWVNDGQRIPKGVRASYRFIHGVLQTVLRRLGYSTQLTDLEAISKPPFPPHPDTPPPRGRVLTQVLRDCTAQPHSNAQDLTPNILRRCFEAPQRDDLLIKGQKVVGGAQWHSRGCVLHQGTIRLPWDKSLIQKITEAFAETWGCEWRERPLSVQEWTEARSLSWGLTPKVR